MLDASCQPTIIAAEHVDHEAEEHDALPAAQIREIRHPQPSGAARGEVALDQIGAAAPRRVGLGGAPRLPAPLRALDPVGGHQPLHPAARRPARRRAAAPSTSADTRTRSSWPRASRGSRSSSRSSSTRARRALAGRAAGSRRTPTRPGSGRSARPRSARDAHRCSALTSVGLGRAPSRKTPTPTSGSRSRGAARSSRWRSLRISSRSSLVSSSGAPTARRPPPGAHACATSPRWTPRSAATCAIGRPDSNTSRTPRSNNSSGYFLGRGMTRRSPLPRTEILDSKPPSNPAWLTPAFVLARVLRANCAGVAAYVPIPGPSRGQSPPTVWLRRWPSRIVVDDRPDARDQTASQGSSPAPSARIGGGGRVL